MILFGIPCLNKSGLFLRVQLLLYQHLHCYEKKIYSQEQYDKAWREGFDRALQLKANEIAFAEAILKVLDDRYELAKEEY